jgi:tRNA pseudouridine38-40 synthase
MPRYFIEVSYKGTLYSGFQIQNNANTIQAEVEKALRIYYKQKIDLTGSSRTDAGVHANQNYFHFDENSLEFTLPAVYHLNAILPPAIVIKRIVPVKPDAHCRFDALRREYIYYIYQHKDPFLVDRAYYFPYKIDLKILQDASLQVTNYKDFTSFSKKNTQVNNFICSIYKSSWVITENLLEYHVIGNRFLRGMVRGIVSTLLKTATQKISPEEFIAIIENKDLTKADFSAPSCGLFLQAIDFPAEIFI